MKQDRSGRGALGRFWARRAVPVLSALIGRWAVLLLFFPNDAWFSAVPNFLVPRLAEHRGGFGSRLLAGRPAAHGPVGAR